MAHDDLGSTTGDRVRIVETRPLSGAQALASGGNCAEKQRIDFGLRNAKISNFKQGGQTAKSAIRNSQFEIPKVSIMIQMQTSLEVADNSGARRVEMIMGIGGATGAIAGSAIGSRSP